MRPEIKLSTSVGMAGAPGRSTHFYANSKRPVELFERIAH